MAKKNPYEGTATFYVDGRSADELGQEYISALVVDGFIRAMMNVHVGAANDTGLTGWTYKGLNCEKYRKDFKDNGSDG